MKMEHLKIKMEYKSFETLNLKACFLSWDLVRYRIALWDDDRLIRVDLAGVMKKCYTVLR